MNKKVSILMPVFNAEEYLTTAINSILNQTYDKIELLICDDCSTDNSLAIINVFKDKRIKLFLNNQNIGYLRTCNRLFGLATGDYIAFQDADDWSHEERILKQVQTFKNNASLGICGTFAQYYDEKGLIKTFQKIVKTSHDEILENIPSKSQFCGASIMITKDVYVEIGGYRNYFDRIGNEDYDWSSRIVEKFISCNIPEYLYNVRQSPNSITRKIRNPKQLISDEVVRLLISQRRLGKKDELEIGLLCEIKKLESQLQESFTKDPSLIYRKSADVAWYNKNLKSYWLCTFYGLLFNPLKIINYKYFLMAIYRLAKYRLN